MGIKFGFNKQSSSDDVAETSSIDIANGGAATELRSFRKQHRWDPYLDSGKLDTIDAAIASGDMEKQAAIDESLLQEDSPYMEVRVSVPPTDDESMPCDTLRAWVIGAFICTIVAACNILLSMRRATISISSTLVQLVSYPIGCFLARTLPEKSFKVFGQTIELNPGPFNVKEHTIITMMTAAGTGTSYAFDILLAQEVFYHQKFKWGFQLMLTLSTQAMGFGIAGVARRFLIWPSSMVWPATLITCAVMHSLHNHAGADPATTNGWSIGRYKFFLIVAGSIFCYEWIPLVIAPFLSLFTFATWIAPNNVLVNQLLGGQTGIGLLPITFDWGNISSFLLSPLQYPGFALINIAFGLFIVTLGIVGLGYAGPEYFKYIPLSANGNFDHFTEPYNVSRIITPDFTLNETAYAEYSPIIFGPAFSLSYCMSFAALISTLTHVALFYGPDIWQRARSSKCEEADIHLKLMRKYKEAPEWWFSGIFLVSFAMGMATALAWPTHLPWWAFIITILIGVFFFIPVGMIQAVTNQQTGLNVICELVVGYMLPGRPIAMMLFKSWGYMLVYNGLNYIFDMKVGHYMKVPPRSMFRAQAFAVIWLSIVQVAAYNFVRGNIDGVCTPDQPLGFTCPSARTFYNASVIWGLIGPRRVFGAGSIYSWTNYFWLIGFAMPVIQYLIARKYPRSMSRFIVWPVVFGAAGMIPPATLYYLWSFVIFGLAFNVIIKRKYLGWWSEYTYVMSGALDIGTAFCVVISGVALGLSNSTFPDWWGTTVPFTNLDAVGAVTKVLNPSTGEFIGPKHW